MSAESPSIRRMDEPSRQFGRMLAILFVGLVLILGAGGYLYLSRLQARARADVHEELSAIADLKLAQIMNWREERLADARFFSRARFVSQDIRRFLEDARSSTNRSAVLHWLSLLKNEDRYYEVVVFDGGLQPRLALPESAAGEPLAQLREMFDRVSQSRDVVMTDFHRDETNGPNHLDMLFPVFAEDGPGREAPMAAVLLKLDARRFLFPLIQSWPTPSKTAETLLVRQEGEEVVFMNDLRHRPGTAMTLRLPLSLPRLPAAWALRGETQAIEGVDYRGVPVVAVGRKIPGTPWAMVAKEDREEIYRPLRQQVVWVAAALGTLLLSGALGVGLVWRQRSAYFLERELELAERVAHLMRHANDVILLLNREGRILEANERALRAYGYSADEMRQKGVRDLRAPEAQGGLEEYFQRLNTEGALYVETIHRRKDGTQFPVEVSSRIIKVGGEDLILSIARDITRRKANEREIARLNQLYLALSHVNQAVVRAASRNELLQEICRVLVEFGGFQMACVVWAEGNGTRFVPVARFGAYEGNTEQIGLFTDSGPATRGPIGTAIHERRHCVCNDLEEVPEGPAWRELAVRSGWRSLAAFPVTEGGSVRGALTVFSQQNDFFGPREQGLLVEAAADASFGLEMLRKEAQRRQAEEALRESEARFRAIFSNAGLGIGELNNRNEIQEVNERWCQIVGRSREQVLGLNVRELTHPEDRATSDRLNEDLWAGRVPLISYEKRYVRGNGEPVWVRVTVSALPDPAGQPVRGITVVEDISERKAAEAALVAAHENLERTVTERTAQLVEANSNLQTFAYSAAHDLRSPLRTVRSFTGIVLDEYTAQLDAAGQSYLARVAQAADHMGRLLDDLLEYSKLSQMEMELSEVSLEKVVQEAIALLEVDIRAKGADVAVGRFLPVVIAHRATLVLVLTNLLSNALKFMPPGAAPKVRVWSEAEGPILRLSVEDNGIGIEPGARRRLFQVFQRLHGRGVYPGTGLGLALVRRAVERMGGQVGVDSEPGSGSRFWFTLKLATPGSEEAPDQLFSGRGSTNLPR